MHYLCNIPSLTPKFPPKFTSEVPPKFHDDDTVGVLKNTPEKGTVCLIPYVCDL